MQKKPFPVTVWIEKKKKQQKYKSRSLKAFFVIF